jgi:hypothetical protein
MTRKRLRGAWLLAILAGSAGCAAPRILGRATMVDENGAPLPDKASGVTLNFINLEGKIEESIPSIQTDPEGKYESPVLPPGKYTVEAVYPGYVIERTSVVLKKHGKKKAMFVMKRIREARGKSVRESKEENIPSPGEVQIKPPF